ncbi:MAG TPA: beta-ketoacyl synthase N-terminal-like domain-containing protein, partial [Xanthobacteraceae bacterium]|nr:beta-ketoacyl synthase N-terminal-like domain-containing protein [Xanthobacteraceae bacterium]
MANQFKDSMGRPIVVVTGMGVVTSLGQGKEDNWKKLTSGVSGIHRITRFPIDGLKTTISGTVDFLFDRPVAAPELSERLAALAAEEAVAQSGIGAKADFPGPLFCAVPPVEIEWPQRNAIAAEADPAAAFTPELALEISGRSRHPEWHEMFLFGTVADRIADRFGTKGLPISVSTACASGGTAIQLGAEAIRRGDCEAAPALGTDGSGHAEPLIR